MNRIQKTVVFQGIKAKLMFCHKKVSGRVWKLYSYMKKFKTLSVLKGGANIVFSIPEIL